MLGCNYILLDGARIGPEISKIKDIYALQGKSLYIGKSKEELEDVGPFLFQIKPDDELAQWFEESGWGNSYGILAFSNVLYDDLFKHNRKFLLVRTEDQQELYFRFYDPRVLRIFLPTCTPSQLREFFGPIDYFILEDEDPKYCIKFQLDREQLKTNRFLVSDIISSNNHFSSYNSLDYSMKEIHQESNKTHIESEQSQTLLHDGQQGKKQVFPPSEKSKKKWNDFFFEE